MQVTETLTDGLKRGFAVVVPAADVESRRSKRVAELSRTINLPGFRPGKVPTAVVVSRYGKAIIAEVLEDSVQEATQQVLTERGLRAAVQPKVEMVNADPAKDIAFNLDVELLPEITMPDFAALEITRLKAEPAEEQITSQLDGLAQRQRTLEEIAETRPAAKGEFLTLDFEGKIDGVAFPGGKAEGMDVEVAGPGFIPGFTEQLEGLAPGEKRQLKVSFPAEYGAADLAGKDATFDVIAHKLKRGVVPAVDEELAKKIGFESLDELKTTIKSGLQRELDRIARLRVKRELLDALAGKVDFPVPESMVEGEFGQIWQRIEADRKAGHLDAEDAGKDEETLKKDYRAIAERRVRLGLLLAEIGRANSITVAQDELARAMRAEASRYPGQEQKVMEFFQKNPQAIESVRAPLFEEKVVDYVLELAKVTDKTVTPEELAKDPDEATPDAAAKDAAAKEPAAGTPAEG